MSLRQEEKLLRQQHANGRAVECVMQRVQSILDTMMPAQVVKEIAEHPVPRVQKNSAIPEDVFGDQHVLIMFQKMFL